MAGVTSLAIEVPLHPFLDSLIGRLAKDADRLELNWLPFAEQVTEGI